MSSGHQRITWRRNIVENFNRLSRVHERYRRQTTDDRQTDGRRHNSEQFTFVKKMKNGLLRIAVQCWIVHETLKQDIQNSPSAPAPVGRGGQEGLRLPLNKIWPPARGLASHNKRFTIEEIIKIVGTRCQILRLKCTKSFVSWGSARNPRLER